MNTTKETSCEYFEHLLWQNELEFNNRELAIFESFLINKGKCIPSHIYTEFMSQIYNLLRNSSKMLADLKTEKNVNSSQLVDLASNPSGNLVTETVRKKTDIPYMREEMFYFKQQYRQFRKQFCSFVGGLEIA